MGSLYRELRGDRAVAAAVVRLKAVLIAKPVVRDARGFRALGDRPA